MGTEPLSATVNARSPSSPRNRARVAAPTGRSNVRTTSGANRWRSGGSLRTARSGRLRSARGAEVRCAVGCDRLKCVVKAPRPAAPATPATLSRAAVIPATTAFWGRVITFWLRRRRQISCPGGDQQVVQRAEQRRIGCERDPVTGAPPGQAIHAGTGLARDQRPCCPVPDVHPGLVIGVH